MIARGQSRDKLRPSPVLAGYELVRLRSLCPSDGRQGCDDSRPPGSDECLVDSARTGVCMHAYFWRTVFFLSQLSTSAFGPLTVTFLDVVFLVVRTALCVLERDLDRCRGLAIVQDERSG